MIRSRAVPHPLPSPALTGVTPAQSKRCDLLVSSGTRAPERQKGELFACLELFFFGAFTLIDSLMHRCRQGSRRIVYTSWLHSFGIMGKGGGAYLQSLHRRSKHKQCSIAVQNFCLHDLRQLKQHSDQARALRRADATKVDHPRMWGKLDDSGIAALETWCI